MKLFRFMPLKNQKGDMLLEALISMLLMAIVALGVTFALSRVAANARDTKVHVQVVNQLRQKLLTTSRNKLCNQAQTITVLGQQQVVVVDNCTKTVPIKNKKDGSEIKISGAVATINAPLLLTSGNYSVGGD